jgi:hypothetical protein
MQFHKLSPHDRTAAIAEQIVTVSKQTQCPLQDKFPCLFDLVKLVTHDALLQFFESGEALDTHDIATKTPHTSPFSYRGGVVALHCKHGKLPWFPGGTTSCHTYVAEAMTDEELTDLSLLYSVNLQQIGKQRGLACTPDEVVKTLHQLVRDFLFSFSKESPYVRLAGDVTFVPDKYGIRVIFHKMSSRINRAFYNFLIFTRRVFQHGQTFVTEWLEKVYGLSHIEAIATSYYLPSIFRNQFFSADRQEACATLYALAQKSPPLPHRSSSHALDTGLALLFCNFERPFYSALFSLSTEGFCPADLVEKIPRPHKEFYDIIRRTGDLKRCNAFYSRSSSVKLSFDGFSEEALINIPQSFRSEKSPFSAREIGTACLEAMEARTEKSPAMVEYLKKLLDRRNFCAAA